MGHKNGNYICDKCGIISQEAKDWKTNVFTGDAICANCLQQEKQARLLEEQNELLKKQQSAANEKTFDEYRGWVKALNGLGLLLKWSLFFTKWGFCFIWGGPYILYKAVKGKSKPWIFVGVEFIIVLILSGITGILFPEEDPLYYLNYITVSLLLINIVVFIYFYVKKRHDFDDKD